MKNSKPNILILGGNFAGLGSAQKIRDYAKDHVDITVIDRKAFIDYIPNIPFEIFEGRNPAVTMNMELAGTLAHEDIAFHQAEVLGLDLANRKVQVRPNERPGSPEYAMSYDYLVIALGAELAYRDIEGFAEHGHTVSDSFHANRLIAYLKNDYKGGPIAIGSARFQQGTRGRPDWLLTALAACEGPPVELSLSLCPLAERKWQGWAGEHHYLHSGRVDRRGRRRKSSGPTPGGRIVDGIQIHQQNRGHHPSYC